MAVQEIVPYSEALGNGVSKQFPLDFPCDTKESLKVQINGIDVPKERWSFNKNNVIFITAPERDSLIQFRRLSPSARLINYETYNESFRSEVLNQDLDKIWWKIQELGLEDSFLEHKLQKVKDDIQLTALENTLLQAEMIRDDTAESSVKVQDDVLRSRELLENTKSNANLALNFATNASTSQDRAELAASSAITQSNSLKLYVDKALSSFTNGALKVYQTIALATADIDNISTDTKVEVLSDENGGSYFKHSPDAKVLTKSPYDPYLHVKNTLESYATVKSVILTNQDLFNLSDDGVYIRPYSTGITEDMNYPKVLAGVLTRFSNKQTGSNKRVFLTYQVFNTNKKYTATLVNNVWGPWLEDIDKTTLDYTLTNYRKITRYTNSTQRDLNAFDKDGLFYFSGNTATAAALNKPENTPFALEVQDINEDGLTIQQKSTHKSGNIYTRIGLRPQAGADIVWQTSWDLLVTDKTIANAVSFLGYVKANDTSGVVQIGVLTPTAIKDLGYVSAEDIATSGQRYVTSSTSAASLGLPTGRAGMLNEGYEGTTASSKTGVRSYMSIGKHGIYRSNRAAGSSSVWTDWHYIPTETEVEAMIAVAQSDSIDKSVENSIIGIGSSSMDRWGTQLTIEIAKRKRSYINAGFSGTTAAVAAMYCGHANYYLNFATDTVLQNGVAASFTFSNEGFGTSNSNPSLDNRGWKVTLENGVYGQLNGYAKTFVPENLDETLTVSGAIKINSDYARYKRAINIVNTGKNNMSDIAYDVIINSFDETIRQIRAVQGNDDRFVVIGHFANRDYSTERVALINKINADLKNKYGNRYIDSKSWVCSSQVWIDLGITPTEEDLILQSTENIPRSLASDGVHMNTVVGNYFVTNFIIPKLVSLNLI